MRTLIRSLVEKTSSAVHECADGESGLDLYAHVHPDRAQGGWTAQLVVSPLPAPHQFQRHHHRCHAASQAALHAYSTQQEAPMRAPEAFRNHGRAADPGSRRRRELTPTRTPRPGLWLSAALLLLLPLSACSDPAGTAGGVERDTVSVHLAVDSGEIGLIVDVRDIFKKGYIAESVAIAFPAHPDFDATLEVNSTTSLAILRIRNDSLTQAEKVAFADGVRADIVVYDGGGAELANRTEQAWCWKIPPSRAASGPPCRASSSRWP